MRGCERLAGGIHTKHRAQKLASHVTCQEPPRLSCEGTTGDHRSFSCTCRSRQGARHCTRCACSRLWARASITKVWVLPSMPSARRFVDINNGCQLTPPFEPAPVEGDVGKGPSLQDALSPPTGQLSDVAFVRAMRPRPVSPRPSVIHHRFFSVPGHMAFHLSPHGSIPAPPCTISTLCPALSFETSPGTGTYPIRGARALTGSHTALSMLSSQAPWLRIP